MIFEMYTVYILWLRCIQTY